MMTIKYMQKEKETNILPPWLKNHGQKAAASSGASISVASRRAQHEKLGTSTRGITGRRKERGFPLPFLPCAPTAFAARERRLGTRQGLLCFLLQHTVGNPERAREPAQITNHSTHFVSCHAYGAGIQRTGLLLRSKIQK